MTTELSIGLVGAGGTALADLWTLARRRLFATALPNYALVGRWIGRMAQREFRHSAIARATPVRGEGVIGWTAHYLVGIAFAALLPAVFGGAWLRAPTVAPALLIGVATVAAPFLLMQPAMGAGFAASRTPAPGKARLHSLVFHGVFGLGLYLSALALQPLLTGE